MTSAPHGGARFHETCIFCGPAGVGAPVRGRRLLGGALHHQGFTVLCMRMAGHGTTPEDMEHMNWENWFDSVMDGYSLLEGCCERISVVGHSMGGLMAMLLSTRAEIYKIVSLAAPIFIADERELRLLPPS